MESRKFMIADGTYCHIIADKIVLGESVELKHVPEMNHNNKNVLTVISAVLMLLLSAGFTALYFTERMIPELWIGVLALTAFVLFRLWIFRDTSATNCVEKKYISSTKLIRREMGYAVWVIFFTTNKGQKLRRFVKLYDSKEFEDKAEKILREEGLIP